MKRRISQVKHLSVTNDYAATMFFLNMQTWKSNPFIQKNYSSIMINQLQESLQTLMRNPGGDKWYSIDYSRDPETWMKPMEFSNETDLVEIPASWYLDDWPPTVFIKGISSAWTSPSVLFDMWKAEFDFLYEKEEGVFPLTIHPDTTRPRMIVMLHEPLIKYILGHPGAAFCTYEEYTKEWKAKNPGKR